MCGSLSALCAASCAALRGSGSPAAAPPSALLHHLGPSRPQVSRRVGGPSGADNAQVVHAQTRTRAQACCASRPLGRLGRVSLVARPPSARGARLAPRPTARRAGPPPECEGRPVVSVSSAHPWLPAPRVRGAPMSLSWATRSVEPPPECEGRPWPPPSRRRGRTHALARSHAMAGRLNEPVPATPASPPARQGAPAARWWARTTHESTPTSRPGPPRSPARAISARGTAPRAPSRTRARQRSHPPATPHSTRAGRATPPRAPPFGNAP